MNNRVTLLQAKRLRRLGYNQPCSTYHCAAGNQIKVDKPMNWNAEKRKFWYDSSGEHECTSIPKCDDVIDWLRKNHSIFVDNVSVLYMTPTRLPMFFVGAYVYEGKAPCVIIRTKRSKYKDIFAAKRDVIAKCLTYIESLSK